MRVLLPGYGQRATPPLGRSCGRLAPALVTLVLGSACATDSLNRLGAGRASISAGALPNATDGQLSDTLRADSVTPDAGVVPINADGGPPDGAPDEVPQLPVLQGTEAQGPELMPNPSFESGHTGWQGFGDSRILDVLEAHSGSRSILSTNRTRSWEGPIYEIRSLVVPGQPYAISAWVRNELDTHNIMLTLKTTCDDDIDYTRLATRAVANQWVQIDASFFAPDCPQLDELSVYVEGPPANKNLLVDDVSLRSVSVATSETPEP